MYNYVHLFVAAMLLNLFHRILKGLGNDNPAPAVDASTSCNDRNEISPKGESEIHDNASVAQNSPPRSSNKIVPQQTLLNNKHPSSNCNGDNSKETTTPDDNGEAIEPRTSDDGSESRLNQYTYEVFEVDKKNEDAEQLIEASLQNGPSFHTRSTSPAVRGAVEVNLVSFFDCEVDFKEEDERLATASALSPQMRISDSKEEEEEVKKKTDHNRLPNARKAEEGATAEKAKDEEDSKEAEDAFVDGVDSKTLSTMPAKKRKLAKSKKKRSKRKIGKAEKKAARREMLRKRGSGNATRKSLAIDFSNFTVPSVDPLSQRLEGFNEGEHTILSYMIDGIDSDLVCQYCMDLAVQPMRFSCCKCICCFECFGRNGTRATACPSDDCLTIIPDIEYCPEIDDRIELLPIHCPSGCGWYGTLNEYPMHSSLHCYQASESDRVDVIDVKRFDRSEINDDILNISLKAKELQLGFELDIRKSSASTLFRSQCNELMDIALMMDNVSEDIHEDEVQREKESIAANSVIQNEARTLEGLSNSISSKTFGGGVHQTFDYSSWENIHQWINLYARILFGADKTLNCVDIGAGILVAIICGAAVSSNMHWMGIEIDPNRIHIGTEIYMLFLHKWENVSDNQRTLHVGFLQGDCTKPLNLRG